LDELEQRIRDVFDDLSQNHREMINHVVDGYVHRLERCLDVGGRNVEQTYPGIDD
jgi:hypothetical protein